MDRWIENWLFSSKTQILFNGQTRKKNNLQNRSKTGDPLSPLMFVLMADWLNNMFRKLEGRGI